MASTPSSSRAATRLILVRHGQTEANVNRHLQGHDDGALTTTGQQQTRDLAAEMRSFGIDQIISSDLSRAKQTARRIAETTGAGVHVTPLVREWNVGELDGQPAQVLAEAFERSSLPKGEFKPTNGESLNELKERAGSFLEDTLTRHSGQTTVIVSHGDFMRALLRNLLALDLEEALTYTFDNASYTVLDQAENGGWQITKLNVSEHLTTK